MRAPLLALLVAALLLALASCVERPRFVTPADGSAIDPAASLDVQIDLGSGFGAASTLRVVLLRGIDGGSPSFVDLTGRFAVASGAASGALDPALDLVEGRNTLFAHVDVDGDGTAENVASASFSYEPALDLAAAARGCDLLDPKLCLYPFPSDFYTVADPAADTGRRVAFPATAMPANFSGVPVDPTEWNRNDGFSPGQALQTLVPGLVLETPGATPADRPVPVPGAIPVWDVERHLAPDASFLVLDAQTGERVPIWAETNSRVPAADSALLIRPAVNFESGRSYVVALRNLRDGAGQIIPPGRAFRLLRDGIPTYVPEIEARRDEMEEIFTFLAQHGVARDELYLAWKFTVISKRNVSERLVHMRDDAFARLGSASPVFQVTNVEDRVGDPEIRYRVSGTVQVPLYVTNGGAPGGSRLRCEDAQGSPRLCQGDELPVYAGSTYSADFRCTVPESADVPGSARPALYGHGLLGSQNEASASHVEDMAFEHRFIFCGTRWIGMGFDDQAIIGVTIIPNFGLFPLLTDRLHQAMLNFLFLGRAMIHPAGFGSHFAFQDASGQSLIDGSELFYDGNSQGAIAGGALAAVAQDFTRAVLGVPGMNYSTLLHRSVDFDPQFLDIVAANYPRAEHPLLFGLAQMLWDRVETNGHANHLTADTYPNTPPKKILLHVAFGDFQVADVTAEIEARTIGAHVHRPGFDPAAYVADNPSGQPRAFFQENPYWDLPAIPQATPVPPVPGFPDATYRWDGSALVVWDSGNVQSPPANVPPFVNDNPELQPCPAGRGGDPHECPRREPSARLQKSEFLRSGGSVVDVCGGMSCLAPGS